MTYYWESPEYVSLMLQGARLDVVVHWLFVGILFLVVLMVSYGFVVLVKLKKKLFGGGLL